MKSTRTGVLAGNFKMNIGLKELDLYISQYLNHFGQSTSKNPVVICPQAPLLGHAVLALRSKIAVGSQNVGLPGSTAQTGELSPSLLRELGVSYAIVGHSERRSKFGEDSPLICERVQSAQSNSITPILCIGETLSERESGKTESVLKAQLDGSLPSDWTEKPLVLAYEPVWAIGTGKTATPEMAQSAHQFIRQYLTEKYGSHASKLSILYGGSVTPENFTDLLKQPDIDGGLVGGASLKPESFFRLTEIFLKAY